MRRPCLVSIVMAVALLSVGVVTAAAQCVPFERTMTGHFNFGWQVDSISTTINGRVYEFGPTDWRPSTPPPGNVDHGWSTHGTEAVEEALLQDANSSFKVWTDFIATVNMQASGYRGDRRDLKLPYTQYFDYRGTADVFDGKGIFKNVHGTLVVRGPFWLQFEEFVWQGVPVAFPVAGEFSFETRGMLCGADGLR